MSFQRLRRALFAAACAIPFVLAACGGSGSVVSEFKPQRVVVFGDAFSDSGQAGARYTINDGSATVWSERLASDYGLQVTASSAGGTSYARGSARVTLRPDAQGNAATPTITDQVTAYVATGTISANDLVLVGGGLADIIAEMRATQGGLQTDAQANANATQAGKELGQQMRRLVNAGARHILVAGAYNLGRAPVAGISGQGALLESLTTSFNDGLKLEMVDLGSSVLYVDTALYVNLVTAAPSAYGYTDTSSVLCTSVDPGVGIGIGAGQVSSLLCNGATLITADAGTSLFADAVYFTPTGNSAFGHYAYERSKDRW